MPLFGKNYAAESDEALMRYVADGNAKAFEVLYERYSTKLVRYFHRMLWKDQEKAEDFMQELFTKIIHKPHQYDPARPFKTWLYSVANNMCKNEYRKQEIRKVTSYELNEATAVADEHVDFGRKIDRDTFNRLLMEELEELDEKKRDTFILRYKEDMSIKEISEAMGCSEGTVKSRIFYTLKHLNKALQVFAPVQSENRL